MRKRINPGATGYLLEAVACKKILKDLERLKEKYKRRVDQEQAKRQAEFETVMNFHSEWEIQEVYGWELITEKQYDRYLTLFREGEAALENHEPTCLELAHGILCRMAAGVERDIREWEFSALMPEQQEVERKRAKESRLAWKRRIAGIKKKRGIIEQEVDVPPTGTD